MRRLHIGKHMTNKQITIETVELLGEVVGCSEYDDQALAAFFGLGESADVRTTKRYVVTLSDGTTEIWNTTRYPQQ